MSSRSDERLGNSMTEWQLGIVFVVAVSVVGGVAALGLRTAGVPFGEVIGFVVGAAITFLVVSYWFYGR